MRLIFSFCFSLFCVGAVLAQPMEYGCHVSRNKGPKPRPLTSLEKTLINESNARSDTFDVLHYDIAIDVTNYSGAKIVAATTITFEPKMADQGFIRFDLLDLQVDSVQDASGNLAFTYDGKILKVDFATVPLVGEIRQLTVYYQGQPTRDPDWGGFYFEAGYIYNLGIGLSTIPPNFGKVWYPCFDSFVERATYDYHVKSAGAYRAYCQGEFMGEQLVAGDTVIRSYKFDLPIPTHVSAIAVSNYQETSFVHTGQYGDMPVNLRAKGVDMSAMVANFVNVGDVIDALEFWYGPQVWPSVGYVMTTDGALEIPTNIAFPDFMVDLGLIDNENLMAHELGHHWWGDAVTPHNHNDMWMKEGPAEYSSHLAREWIGGETAFIKAVKDNQKFVLEQAHVQDNGFLTLSPTPDEYIYGRHTYRKGAAIFHNLRGYLGDSLFRVAMTGVQMSNTFTHLTPAQLQSELEAACGYDLQPFFDAQIYQPGFATFVVDSFQSVAAGNTWNVNVFIQQKLRECPNYHMAVPLDVTVVGANRQRQDFRIMTNGQFSTANVQANFEPKMVILNGHNRLNQNRMDHEVLAAPNQGLVPILPYVAFNLYKDAIVDTTFVRIEHIWGAPDNQNLGPGIFEIGSRHYWQVDGLWPEGTAFHGRISYDAVETYDLDYDLFGVTENDAVLLYRASAAEPWEIYPDFTLNAGNILSGNGSIDIDVLLKGQYAFGKGDFSLTDESVNPTTPLSVLLFPVPAVDQLTVRGELPNGTAATVFFEVLNMQGQLLIRSSAQVGSKFEETIDVSALATGSYVLQVRSLQGKVLASNEWSVAKP